jgi:hypothetical protein
MSILSHGPADSPTAWGRGCLCSSGRWSPRLGSRFALPGIADRIDDISGLIVVYVGMAITVAPTTTVMTSVDMSTTSARRRASTTRLRAWRIPRDRAVRRAVDFLSPATSRPALGPGN